MTIELKEIKEVEFLIRALRVLSVELADENPPMAQQCLLLRQKIQIQLQDQYEE